ncbi:uncharacterized protein LOC110696651 [Chenopodium quinoa]|uniref:uncharacterized protein LOC110696651 n=1 Tax=Chenopodium quinoa TaxID=63459 RepID=UPI000B76FF1E|nr:uncharacterized protein LOC110696651 [Chenopodium quinoa]
MHAPSNPSDRHNYWNEMAEDVLPYSTPWLMLGNLNEVTSQSEKSGGRSFRPSQCHDLNNFMDKASMIDLGFNGNPFIWNNARDIIDHICERLDRALGSAKWLESFPNTKGKGKMDAKDRSISNWIPPREGFMKLNTDEAWKHSTCFWWWGYS